MKNRSSTTFIIGTCKLEVEASMIAYFKVAIHLSIRRLNITGESTIVLMDSESLRLPEHFQDNLISHLKRFTDISAYSPATKIFIVFSNSE